LEEEEDQRDESEKQIGKRSGRLLCWASDEPIDLPLVSAELSLAELREPMSKSATSD